MAKSDTEFAQMAVSLSLVSEEQAAECLQLLARARQQSKRASIADVFVQRGYLTRAQVGAVIRALRQPRIARIGNYKLLTRVGQGGMGTVYKARQESLDKIVAVKVLAPGLARQRDYVERFIREAQASGQLNHPNIVLGIDAGEADGYYYFAMEFVGGESLKAILQREGTLSERRALEITGAMAAALEHAREHNIVHRDIKPGNILLTQDGTPKLADLGLAKEIRTDHSITQAGIPVGTPYYISPEQVRGEEKIDHRADLYALGGTLYHMVTGRVPYDGPTAAVVMTRHLNDPIPDAKAHASELSDATVAIIQHCMQKDRTARYHTPTELREDIGAALAGQPPPHATRAHHAASRAAQRAAERRARQASQRRRLLIAGGAGAGVLVLAIVLVLALGPGKGGGQPPPADRPSTGTSGKAVVQPPKPPEPTPTTETPVVTRDADAVLRELLTLIADEENREDVEERLQDFILQFPGTGAADKAKEHLADLRAQWKAEDGLKALVADHIEHHRYAEALAAIANPPFSGKTEKLQELLGALEQNVRRAAAEHIDAEKARANELVERGDLGEARKVFLALAKLGQPEATEASRKGLEQIQALEAKRRERQATQAFAALLDQAVEPVGEGRLAEARGLFDPAKAAGNAVLQGYLTEAQADVDRIAALFAAVERKLRELARRGGSARIKGILRPVSKVEDGYVACTGGRFRICKLTARDLAELDCAPAPEAIAVLQLYRGEAGEAQAELEKLADKLPAADLQRYRQQIQWRQAAGREGEAADLLAKARQLADQKKWQDAQDAVARLLGPYADTAFVDKNRAAIHDLSARCAAALAATRRDTETIRPFIDITDRCGDLAKALQANRVVGGWVMDIDNDGLLDIALDCRGKQDPRVPVFLNRSEVGAKELVFKDATLYCGIDTGEEPICWADLDGDGDLDVVCRGLWSEKGGQRRSDHTKLSIYEHQGKGAPLFRPRPELSLTPDLASAPGYGGFGFGNIAVIDMNGDGRADILAQYVSGRARTLTLFLSTKGKDLGFVDASLHAGFVQRQGSEVVVPKHLQVQAWPNYVVFDVDGDHRADFIFNTDKGMTFLNRGGRTFAYVPRSTIDYQTYVSPQTSNNPMVVPAVADYDNDGDIDVFVPQKGRNLLLRNDGKGRFVDAMHTAGPMSTDEAVSLWATWADANNDGLLDLFVCNSGERNRLYIQKANHAFVDKAEEFGCTGERGEKTNFVAFGDLDRDGDLDMIVLRETGRSQVLLNPYVTGRNRYSISVVVKPPKGAIGAKVYLLRPPSTIVGLQQVCRVEGYNGQTSREAFFGVPAAGDYLVRVILSNGTVLSQRVAIDPTRLNRIVIGK